MAERHDPVRESPTPSDAPLSELTMTVLLGSAVLVIGMILAGESIRAVCRVLWSAL